MLKKLLYNNLTTTNTELCYKIYCTTWQLLAQNSVLKKLLYNNLTTTNTELFLRCEIYRAAIWQPLTQNSVTNYLDNYLHKTVLKTLLYNHLTTTCIELCVKNLLYNNFTTTYIELCVKNITVQLDNHLHRTRC